MPKFLHVGCGLNRKDQTTVGFNTADWQEVRFDIDKSVSPDIVGTMTEMSTVADGYVDAIFSSHNIEHLYPHEVPLALAEFSRILNESGFVVITCPDLQSVCKLIAEDKLTETAYESPAGPIAPLDILYGYRAAIQAGNLFMAHKCGFTEKVLIGLLQAAGFKTVASRRRDYPYYDLYVLATKAEMSAYKLKLMAQEHFP